MGRGTRGFVFDAEDSLRKKITSERKCPGIFKTCGGLVLRPLQQPASQGGPPLPLSRGRKERGDADLTTPRPAAKNSETTGIIHDGRTQARGLRRSARLAAGARWRRRAANDRRRGRLEYRAWHRGAP